MNWKTITSAIVLYGAAGTASAVGNLADVTVYDRAQGRTLPVYQYEGRHYVVGKPGSEYQIRVRNRSGADVLAVMSVDGVNVVSGETANWSQPGYVLGRYQGFDVKGWRKSMERTAAFFFTEHENSYAARTGRPDHVGVIGVAMFRKKSEPEAFIQRDRLSESHRESSGTDGGAGASAESSAPRAALDGVAGTLPAPAPQLAEKSTSLGTGHGRSETSRATYTSFARATLHPEEVIAIHYDTYSNLVAMGVIRASQIARPTPFPGQFVPDPR
jgi:hypothetical protein